MAGKVFAKDNLVDRINADAIAVLAEHMSAHPDAITDCLHLHSAIRRIERIGDRCSNIAEDIVFYLGEVRRVLKHHDIGPAEEK